MALAPADFYAYSRATGVPVPEDPEERAALAPEILEFRRNQLKGPESEGVDPLSVGIGLGLAAAGAGAGAYGIRSLLRGRDLPKQEGKGGSKFVDLSGIDVTGQDVKTASQASVDDLTPPPSRQPTTTQTAPVTGTKQLSSTRPDVNEFLMSQIGKQPDDLTSFQRYQLTDVSRQASEAVDTGLDQTIQNIDVISQRDIDNVRSGGFVSAEDIPADPLLAGIKVNANESVVAQLNKRKALRQQALNQARQSLGIDAADAPLPEGFEQEMSPGEKAGTLAQQALRDVRDRRQRVGPAPISQGYKEALFNVSEGGVLTLKPEVIAKNLGDPNVFPDALRNEIRDSIKASSSTAALNSGDLSGLEISNPGVLQRATQHVMQNLLAEDDANTIKDYLLSGGEIQNPSTKGFGYTGTQSRKTEVVTITNKKGEQKINVSGPRASTRYTRSDLEPLYFDEDTGSLIRKSDIGATKSSEGEGGSGIGEEIGQAVGFVPREKLQSFVASPGGRLLVEDDDDYRYKGQGADYAVGGLKEFGSTGTRQISPEAWQEIRQKRKELGLKWNETTPEIEAMLQRARSTDVDLSVQELPLFKNAIDAVESGAISIASNGKPYLKVNSLMLKATPGIENLVDQRYGTLYTNPLTGQDFTSEYDALGTYNRLANNLNAKLIKPAEMRVDALSRGENLNVQLSRPGNKVVSTQLNPNLVIDQVTRRSPKGDTITTDVTLAQGIRNQLLNPFLRGPDGAVLRDGNTGLPMRGSSLIEEQRVVNEDGSLGATYYRQARYQVPEDRMYLDTKTGERKPKALGLNDASLPLVTGETQGSKNNYLFLQGVNNALEDLTGQRVKAIDDALLLAKQPGFEFLGGPSKNPVLREALTIANTLTQTSEKSRVRMPGAEDEGLAERYGLGARSSERLQRNIPSRQQTFALPVQQVTQTQMRDPNTGELKNVTQLVPTNQSRNVEVPSDVLGGKRLAAALVDYRSRSGRPMKRQDFLQMAADIAAQESADVNAVIKQASQASRGAGAQAVTGRLMSQGRRALSAMDRPSPAEEIAQTIAEYDFGETIGSDIETAVRGAQAPADIDMELTARQAQRAKVEPPGTTERFTSDDPRLANMMERLRAQAGRRSGKRRRR